MTSNPIIDRLLEGGAILSLAGVVLNLLPTVAALLGVLWWGLKLIMTWDDFKEWHKKKAKKGR